MRVFVILDLRVEYEAAVGPTRHCCCSRDHLISCPYVARQKSPHGERYNVLCFMMVAVTSDC